MSIPVPQTILIADDDPSQLMLAEAALAGAGLLVHTVTDGDEAVQQFASVQPACVILDVNMPRMSGIDACREIRKLAGSRVLPILMLTGRNDLPAISDAYAAGASDFAQKGMNPRLLVERVRFLLRDRELQEELRSSRSKLLLAQSIARVGHWELAADGRTLHVSPMLGELLGVEPERLASYEDFVALLDASERHDARTGFITCATGNGRVGIDHSIRTAEGGVIHLHQEADFVPGAGGPDDGVIIVTLQDLTRLHHAEESVRRLSYFDTVTGLPNRRHLAEQAKLALAEPGGAAATGIVAFRVHNFDAIVQAQGREFGDQLITRIAGRLEAEFARLGEGGTIMRRADSPSVCRSADGELAVLMRSRVSAEHIATVTQAALEAISAQALQPDSEYVPAISAGVALAEGGALDAEQLLGNAHAAAEVALDPRSCAFFSAKSQAQLRRRLAIESSLRSAVERRELHLNYQPRVAIDTFELTGVECLVSWDHPQYGKIRPEEFVSIAEQSGIIDDIGRWMIEEACRQMAAWREHFDRKFFASVSVSRRQLRDPRLVTMIQAALERHRLPPDALQIELAEASIVESPDAAQAVLEGLRSRGVRIGIDDFGTGRSSLGRMRRIPFKSMKLDRALMADLYIDPWTQGVAAAVLSMARAHQSRSVADGIDDAATLEMLRALGFDEVQGRYVAPPMKTREFEHWLETGGSAHLAQRHGFKSDDATETAGITPNDVMKWANG